MNVELLGSFSRPFYIVFTPCSPCALLGYICFKQLDSRIAEEQVLNPQKGVSGTYSFKLMHIYIAPKVNSWRSEVGSVDGLQNSIFGLVVGLQYSTLGWVVGLQYSSSGWVVKLQYYTLGLVVRLQH